MINRGDLRDIAEAASRPGIPRPDAAKVIDLVQLDDPAWVSQFRQNLVNFIGTKIDGAFNELKTNYLDLPLPNKISQSYNQIKVSLLIRLKL